MIIGINAAVDGRKYFYVEKKYSMSTTEICFYQISFYEKLKY